MPNIIYVEHDGTEHPVDVEAGMSLMEGATLNMVPGVEGMCGGICSCATCHCYLPEELLAKLPEIEKGEEIMLEGAMERRENSRLGCQVFVDDSMDGLRVNLPVEQG